MLAIGRALMGEPKVILLDEPPLGLARIVLLSVYKTIKDEMDSAYSKLHFAFWIYGSLGGGLEVL